MTENSLNSLGYKMLQAEEFDHAVAIFDLNVEFSPKSANGYDSLAEVYMTIGDRERAIALYKKALETLDRYPDENRGRERLRDSIPKQLEKLRDGQ